MVRATGKPMNSFCLACFYGDYPLPVDPFFFNDTATTEIYTLSLHDALPIPAGPAAETRWARLSSAEAWKVSLTSRSSRSLPTNRSEEHTSELQSRPHLV